MNVLTVVAALSLLSVSAAKPLSCEDLIRPVVLNETMVTENWFYIEARTDHQRYTELLKTLNSSVMDVVLSPHNGTAVIKQRHMLNGKCRYVVHDLNLTNDAIHRAYENGSVTITILPACPDCLVMSFICLDDGAVIRALKLFGKTKTLNPSDFEMYEKQAECLGLPPPSFKYDGKQDICPEEEDAAATEEEKH